MKPPRDAAGPERSAGPEPDENGPAAVIALPYADPQDRPGAFPRRLRGARLTGRRLADEVLAMAPRVPVRDLETLRRQFPGLDPDDLSDALIDGAVRASGAVGAAVGFGALLPVLPLFPAEVAAEVVAVTGIELKLIAELHEVYGLRAPGSLVERMTSYVAIWADRRGVALTPGFSVVAGPALRRSVTRRVMRKSGRSVLSLGPLLSGAALGALANRRETRQLGRAVRTVLREHARR